MSLLLLVGWSILLLLAVFYAIGMVDSAKLRKARGQYAKVQSEHGNNAPYHCPHAFVSLTADASSDVSRRWCRVCGKHIGTAASRRRWFGALRRHPH